MIPHEDHHDPADRAELDATAYALGELAARDAETVAARLAADVQAKRLCAETKVIADDLRDAYEAAALPPASDALRASLDNYLTTANSEDRVVTKAPDILPRARRRFTPLEIILSIAVLCLGSLVVLMNMRQDTSTAMRGPSAPVSNFDRFHRSESRVVITDGTESMTSAPDLAQTRMPQGSDPLSKYSISESKPSPEMLPHTYWANEYGDEKGEASLSVLSSAVSSKLPGSSSSGNGVLQYDANGPDGLGPRVTGAPATFGLDPRRDSPDDYDFSEGFYAATPAIGGFDAAKAEKDKELREAGRRGGDQHARIYENNFKLVGQDPLSTFSIDVDTASYSKLRQHILQHGQLPPPDAIRIEELINYFPYDYNEPMDEHPFAAHMEVAQCPWQAEHRLARIAIKGKEMKPDERPASNLVFLVDVSGSMNEANKLPLVIRGLEMLTRELGKNDRVAIVVYAGAAGLVLPSTSGDEKETILAALGKLEAGGSTAGAEGINLAYKTAEENFIHAGVNRVILCSDGDFNVGVSDTGSLVRLAEEQAKKNIFLSILGFGIGNLNDEMLEQVSDKANGMYAFIDTENEARKVLVEQMSGTLVTIAKDVKIQIEFNPAKVAAYRLIGYENRILAAEDFNNDKKDAGEIGAGHTVTALYEIVPVIAKEKPEIPAVDELKYQRPSELTDAAESDELLTLKLRYKSPEGEKSTLLSEPVDDSTEPFGKVSDDFKFAAAVASFGMLLRGSEYSGDATMDAVLEIATDGAKHDEWGYRKEFLEIVKRAKELKK